MKDQIIFEQTLRPANDTSTTMPGIMVLSVNDGDELSLLMNCKDGTELGGIVSERAATDILLALRGHLLATGAFG
jgi:hypothetical protein